MRTRPCDHCKKEYAPTGSRNRTCSIDCRIALQSEVMPSGCIEWRGAVGSHGYGVLNVGGDIVTVPRLVYQLRHGTIQQGVFVCHRCDNKLCINASHLFSGTPADNARDMTAKGRHWIKGKQLPEEYRARLRVPKSRHRWMRTD